MTDRHSTEHIDEHSKSPDKTPEGRCAVLIAYNLRQATRWCRVLSARSALCLPHRPLFHARCQLRCTYE